MHATRPKFLQHAGTTCSSRKSPSNFGLCHFPLTVYHYHRSFFLTLLQLKQTRALKHVTYVKARACLFISFWGFFPPVMCLGHSPDGLPEQPYDTPRETSSIIERGPPRIVPTRKTVPTHWRTTHATVRRKCHQGRNTNVTRVCPL